MQDAANAVNVGQVFDHPKWDHVIVGEVAAGTLNLGPKYLFLVSTVTLNYL